MNAHLVLPFASSLLYVVGVLLIKRSNAFGVGVWRTTFLTNLVTAVLFLALLPLGGGPVDPGLLWQPALVAALFVGAQGLAFLALQHGDVSVATPALGSKTVWVAWFSVLMLGVRLPWQLWVAAVLSFLAIALLQGSGGIGGRSTGRTVAISLLAAGGYACFDVLVQKWSPGWGPGVFLPIMFGMAAVLSLAFLPLFPGPLREIPRAARAPLAAGAFLIALQSLILVTALAVFGDATAMNVIYSARGLWSVAAVWWIGHWFQNRESEHGGEVLARRLVGAALMTAAIMVTLMR